MYSKAREPVAATMRTLSMKSSSASRKILQKDLALIGSLMLFPKECVLSLNVSALIPVFVCALSLLLMPSSPVINQKEYLATSEEKRIEPQGAACPTAPSEH